MSNKHKFQILSIRNKLAVSESPQEGLQHKAKRLSPSAWERQLHTELWDCKRDNLQPRWGRKTSAPESSQSGELTIVLRVAFYLTNQPCMSLTSVHWLSIGERPSA